MDNAAQKPQSGESAEARAAPRFTLLIRAARLVAPQGEFVCVIRDVSETGVCVRLFHRLPPGDELELYMPGGGIYPLRLVWAHETEAGFEFPEPIDVARLVNEAGEFPKRGLRLGVCFPIRLTTLSGTFEGVVENLSQQGARFECEALFAIDQTLTIDSIGPGRGLKGVRAKVRWRRGQEYGVVFDDTFLLKDFACLVARLQCPSLVD